MKIDIFNHIFPARFFEEMLKVCDDQVKLKRFLNVPMLVDLDARFRAMDLYGEYCQVLSLAAPPIEVLAGPETSPDLARRANDGMAELCRQHPERFPGFVASLPMNAPEPAQDELHRTMRDLGAVGIQVYSNVAGAPLDRPEYSFLFEAMAEEYDRPIWLHPARGPEMPDYVGETKSLYEIWWTFGWPYETSTAMARLVFSGLFDRHPGIKIICHHMGAMIPYFAGRVGPGWDQLGKRTADEDYEGLLRSLKQRPLDYFKMFYADTALFGAGPAVQCGLEFFGRDRVLFASDSPFDPEGGTMYIRETIRNVDELDISDADRQRIYHDNAVALLGLSGL